MSCAEMAEIQFRGIGSDYSGGETPLDPGRGV